MRHRRAHPHPLQYLCQMCIQSVLSATDLLHVPLELLDQNLQFTDALVCFVSCTAKRPRLNKDQMNTNLNLLETFLHKYAHLWWRKKTPIKPNVDSTVKITWKTLAKILLHRQHAIAAFNLKAKQVMIFTSLVMWLCFCLRSSVNCFSLSLSLPSRELSLAAACHTLPSKKRS